MLVAFEPPGQGVSAKSSRYEQQQEDGTRIAGFVNAELMSPEVHNRLHRRAYIISRGRRAIHHFCLLASTHAPVPRFARLPAPRHSSAQRGHATQTRWQCDAASAQRVLNCHGWQTARCVGQSPSFVGQQSGADLALLVIRGAAPLAIPCAGMGANATDHFTGRAGTHDHNPSSLVFCRAVRRCEVAAGESASSAQLCTL